MNRHLQGAAYEGTMAENYQRHFVPFIGAPLAEDLIAAADPRPGERVLDVACGTGVVTRLAAARVGASGSVAGLDVNPGMLAVARSETPADVPIEWHQASAEAMPLADVAYDLVLCQMGLQFVPNKLAALREMRRVLAPGGRACIAVPGPQPAVMAVLEEVLARHVGPQVASFAALVFSLHDADEMRGLMRDAGFRDVDVRARARTLRLAAPADFLWQYIHSTPMAEGLAQADAQTREALERDACAGWRAFVTDGALSIPVSMTTAIGRS